MTDILRANLTQLRVHARGRYDPTRTTALRNKFAKDMGARFRKLRGLILDAVVSKDVFGLNVSVISSGVYAAFIERRAFDFPRSGDKVAAFMEWLRSQVNSEILTVGRAPQIGAGIESAWTDLYVEDSYKRGVQRARYEMNRSGISVPPFGETGGVDAAMLQPVHLDRMGVLYTRVFEDLKGVTAQMDTQISRVLSQGIADGDGPRLLARKMNAVIKGGGADLGVTDTLGRFIPAERRARMIARTEVIRAHHQGMIQEYRNWAVEGVTVKAEFVTTDDADVCEECDALQGRIFTLDQIQNLIPVHPHCRCISIPVLNN